MTKDNSPQPAINNVLLAGAQVGALFDRLGWQYCLIGGIAVLRWGQPRQTVDVDAVVWAGFGQESDFLDQITEHLESRIDQPHQFATQHRILLLSTREQIDVDIALGRLPFEQRAIERSSVWYVPHHGSIRTCSAEDLVVFKAIANPEHDWTDIKSVLIRQGQKLNHHQILQELQPLVELKEEPEIADHLKQLLNN